jgi:methylated-DNA-[protein]-cysteine S-methyltransferase
MRLLNVRQAIDQRGGRPLGKLVGPAGENAGMRFVIESPIGPLGIVVDGPVVTGIRFLDHRRAATWVGRQSPAAAAAPEARSTGPPDTAHQAMHELAGYFAGTLTVFTVPVQLPGGSEFERAVWEQIAAIPYGETRTYGAIADALGDGGAARIVGTACNRNPVPLIVPCHRVVGAGGKLVGFGGGLDRKRRLLELEARVSLERAWA